MITLIISLLQMNQRVKQLVIYGMQSQVFQVGNNRKIRIGKDKT
jgi:hypothetical protein